MQARFIGASRREAVLGAPALGRAVSARRTTTRCLQRATQRGAFLRRPAQRRPCFSAQPSPETSCPTARRTGTRCTHLQRFGPIPLVGKKRARADARAPGRVVRSCPATSPVDLPAVLDVDVRRPRAYQLLPMLAQRLLRRSPGSSPRPHPRRLAVCFAACIFTGFIHATTRRARRVVFTGARSCLCNAAR
jgi:hypothetical protein